MRTRRRGTLLAAAAVLVAGLTTGVAFAATDTAEEAPEAPAASAQVATCVGRPGYQPMRDRARDESDCVARPDCEAAQDRDRAQLRDQDRLHRRDEQGPGLGQRAQHGHGPHHQGAGSGPPHGAGHHGRW